MNARGLAVFAGIVLTAGLVMGLAAQSSAPNGRLSLDSHRFVGTPKSFRNLTLIPIYAPKAKATNAYITLDEGLKAKTVTVREAAGGGEVNKLFIRNKSGKILYILAGEVVLGGQQDRSLGTDTVIPPDEKEVPVTAFCVEHGRWSGKGEFDRSAKAVASVDVRVSAQEGAFAAARPAASGQAAGVLGRAGRNVGGGAGEQTLSAGVVAQQEAEPASSGRAAQQRVSNQRSTARSAGAPAMTVGRAQQEVWDKVASKNRRFKADSATGTYRGVLEEAAGEVQQSLAPYLKAFEKGLGSDPQMVGVMAAVNGKVITADIFGDPGLFRKLWPKLLRSHKSTKSAFADSIMQTCRE
jgi:hypothetical protein